MLRQFEATASPLGSELQVNITRPAAVAPVIAMDARGGGVVMWQGATSVDGTHPLIARRFGANGTLTSQEIAVGATPASFMLPFSGGHLRASDGFLATWAVLAGESAGIEIVARRFGADNQPLDNAHVVNSRRLGDQNRPAAALHDSGFIIVWESRGVTASHGISGKRHDPSGNELDVPR